ncbi:hypothetical protein AMECASPLE_011280 [Ameca splendens]|uniref:Uncharacterized protein n=1 Tax=Ameca splendens TaxID=208324 RepID=A0ABV0YMU9_9TELE
MTPRFTCFHIQNSRLSEPCRLGLTEAVSSHLTRAALFSQVPEEEHRPSLYLPSPTVPSQQRLSSPLCSESGNGERSELHRTTNRAVPRGAEDGHMSATLLLKSKSPFNCAYTSPVVRNALPIIF